jgi:hypothetical protein
MFGSKSAAVLFLSSLAVAGAAAPAFANHGGFCERIEAKLSAPSIDAIELLERDLRRAINRAADDGCDPFGGMMGNAHCAAHVMQIREQVAEIERAELHGADDAVALSEMYQSANCAGRAHRHVVRLGDEPDLARGSVVSIAPAEEAAVEPDAARFASLDATVEPEPDMDLRTASIPAVRPTPIVHVASEPAPIPDDRRNVRVIGSRFLPDAESAREFRTIATSHLDMPNTLFNRVLAWIGVGAEPDTAASALADASMPVSTVTR